MDTLLQPEEERKFKCDECGRAYRHAGSLSNHKKTHDVGCFQCNICGKENSNALALKNHLRSHTSQKKYPCLECGKTFHWPSQLVTHERVHESRQTKERPPIEVDIGYVAHEDQNGHIDCVLSSGISVLNSPSDSITDVACETQTESNDFVDKPFKSDLSDNLYIHQGSLLHHTKTHQTEIFECSVCFKLFNDAAALSNHQRSHKSKSPVDSLCGPYALPSLDQLSPQNQDVPVNFCHLCQVLFSSQEEFQNHIQMHNSSPLLDQNEGTFYENGTCFSESPIYQPPAKHVSSACSKSHSGSFDLPNEQMANDDLFYHCSDLESAPLNGIETQPSTSVTNHATVVSSGVDSEGRPFKCDICFKTYRHYGSLVNHKRSHQVGDYQCSVCGKSCPHLASFRSHIRIHKVASSHSKRQNWLSSQLQTVEDLQETSEDGMHVGIEPRNECLLNGYLNQDCGETLNYDVSKLQNYLQEQNSISCTSNGNKEHLQDGVENQGIHINFHGINGNDIENNQFSENVSIDDYSCVAGEQEENDRDFYQCSFCGNRYNSIGALRNHMRGHISSHSTPSSSIPACTLSTKQVKEEELSDVIICCLCGESFSSSQDLVNHQLLHSSDQLDDAETLDNNREVNDEKNLICGSCGIFCTSYSHLENHGCKIDTNQSTENEEEVKEANDNADTSLDKEERQFKCEQCGRSYRHSGSLLNHKKSHKTGLFRCHVCQKNFYNLLALKTHQRSHFDIKRHRCECGKAFKTQKQLLNHMRRHKEKQVQFQVQTVTQTEQRSRSEEGELPLSPNGSQDPSTENTNKEPRESDSTVKSEDNSDKRPFACDLCGRTYRHAGSLVNHKNSHKTGEYLCSICNNSYSNQLALKNHLRIHFAFKRHSCLKCGKRLRSRNQLLVHVCTNLKRGRRNFRSKCAKTSTGSGQAIEPPTKKEHLYTCNICNRSYRHAGSLLNHKNTHKTGQYNCSFCSKPFSNLLALRNHTRIHTQKRKYSCLTCGKAFRVASVLYNHQKIHSRGASRFSCPNCGRGFRGRSGLQRHQCPRGQHSGTAEQHSDRDKCFKCDLCGRSYHHAGSLLNHKKTHSENLHHCSLCLQTFPDQLALHAHSQIDRHSCPECGKTFCLLSHMQSHMEVHCKDQKIHQNNMGNGILCDQNGVTEDPIPSSQEKTDSEDKVHVCEHCGRTYRHAGSLLNHKNSHKTGCFLCSICHKEFTNLMALKNHKRIHTEPKRYQCLECGKAFRVSSQLICHRRIHTRERPFACSVCDKTFSSKSNLRHHQKIHQNCMDANAFMDLNINAYL